MSKGGYRPNSGRKKGSTPWNKGIHSGNHGNGFRKGQSAWNKGIKVPSISQKMKGNSNGEGNKGKKRSPETIQRLVDSHKGKPSGRKGSKISYEGRKRMRESKISFLKRINPSYIPYEKQSKYDKARLRKLSENGGLHSQGEWERLKIQYNSTCPKCKRKEPEIKLTRDHIIPISIGGSDNIENIQPLCISCNSAKGVYTIKY